mmetsp:Transcript_53626/g.154590  ORF Transcript_53626/g.154590 Transcript_53626/m.154590 type:complete len:204 (-) Transcript_53626:192-803(-)
MFVSVTPPVGINETCGKMAANALSVPAPPKFEAGKNFSAFSPNLPPETTMTSDGVITPGKYRTPRERHRCATRESKPGDTIKSAPLSTAMSTCCGVSTVPAPTQTPSTCRDTSRIASAAHSVLNVISATSMPPSLRALHKGTACAMSSILITGMTLQSPTLFNTSSWLATARVDFSGFALALTLALALAFGFGSAAGEHSPSQ